MKTFFARLLFAAICLASLGVHLLGFFFVVDTTRLYFSDWSRPALLGLQMMFGVGLGWLFFNSLVNFPFPMFKQGFNSTEHKSRKTENSHSRCYGG